MLMILLEACPAEAGRPCRRTRGLTRTASTTRQCSKSQTRPYPRHANKTLQTRTTTTTTPLLPLKNMASPRKSAMECAVCVTVKTNDILLRDCIVILSCCLFCACAALWATKETEETEANRELRIKTTLRELLVYLVFIIVLCIGAFPVIFLVSAVSLTLTKTNSLSKHTLNMYLIMF